MLPVVLLGIAGLGTIASPLGIWSSHLERMSHFRLGWIGLLFLLAALFVKRRQRFPATAAAAILAWAFLPLLPYWLPPARNVSTRDSALGHGLSSTWQSTGIRLPIDHILVSKSWRVLERRVHSERMGSDHHPVIAVLAD